MDAGAGEFEVIRCALASEHDPVEAVMILEPVENGQAEAVSVEADDLIEIVARSRDTQGWNADHHRWLARAGDPTKGGSGDPVHPPSFTPDSRLGSAHHSVCAARAGHSSS